MATMHINSLFMIILAYILGAIIGWVLFYHVVKAAVTNGVLAAFDMIETKKKAKRFTAISEKPLTAEQFKLQKLYDKGEITFDVYRSEWDKSNK